MSTVRIGARIGSIAVSTLGSFVQSIYEGKNVKNVLIDTFGTLLITSVFQFIGLKNDKILPHLSNPIAKSILNSLGKFQFTGKNMLTMLIKNIFKTGFNNLKRIW